MWGTPMIEPFSFALGAICGSVLAAIAIALGFWVGSKMDWDR